jgi:cellulose synthase/poly-beta-1,6-N-acetylglucosamine synthase-like glycosyltransferase
MELYLFVILPTTFLIFVTLAFYFAYKERFSNKDPIPKNHPSISIIVPVLNEVKTVEGTINSINNAKKKYKGDVEIIAVDDGSSDGTYELLIALEKKIKNLRTFRNVVKSKGLNVNFGAKKAKGELIGVIDADTLVGEDVFNYMVGYFEDPEIGSVVANVIPKNVKKFVERYQEMEYVYVSFVRQALSAMKAMYITPGGGLPLYKKEVFEEVGGYCGPEILTEDMEIALKLIRKGYVVVLSRKAKSYTRVPNTFYKFFRQRVRWYRGTIQTLKKYPDMIWSLKYSIVSGFVLPLFYLLIAATTIVYIYIGSGLYSSVMLNFLKLEALIEIGHFPTLFTFNFLSQNILFTFGHLTIFLMVNFIIWFLAFKEGLKISNKKIGFNILIGLFITIFYAPVAFICYLRAFYEEIRKRPNRWW